MSSEGQETGSASADRIANMKPRIVLRRRLVRMRYGVDTTHQYGIWGSVFQFSGVGGPRQEKTVVS